MCSCLHDQTRTSASFAAPPFGHELLNMHGSCPLARSMPCMFPGNVAYCGVLFSLPSAALEAGAVHFVLKCSGNALVYAIRHVRSLVSPSAPLINKMPVHQLLYR